MGRRRATLLLGATAIGALILGPLTIVAMTIAAVGLALYLLFSSEAGVPGVRGGGGASPKGGRLAELFALRTEDASWASWWGCLLASLPPAVAMHYVIRGRYYWHSKMFLAVVLVAVASAAFYGLVRQPMARPRAWRWLGAALSSSAAALVLVASLAPSASAARRYMASGQLDLARAELSALGDDAVALPLWQELAMREALSLGSCEAVVQQLDELPESMLVEVRAHADRLALAKARTSVAAGRWEEASLAMACGSSALRAGAEAASLGRRFQLELARECRSAGDLSCAMDRVDRALALGAEAADLRVEISRELRAEIEQTAGTLHGISDPQRRSEVADRALSAWRRYFAQPGVPVPPEIIALRKAHLRAQAQLAAQ